MQDVLNFQYNSQKLKVILGEKGGGGGGVGAKE